MSLTHGTMRVNSSERNTCWSGDVLGVLQALLDAIAERLPDLGAAEPVAHQVAALDDELLALVALLAVSSV